MSFSMEGVFIIKDLTKDKTRLINRKTDEEIEVNEGLDVDYEEFQKMKKEGVCPNLFCKIIEMNGKKVFEYANFTNMEDEEEIAETLGDLYDYNEKKTGRNEPCPCASGKKYKKCCMGKNGG